METKTVMPYRYLGPTGIKVSAISYGCMDIRDQAQLNELIQKAWQLGINFFDCAEVYGKPRGQVEELLGEALKTLKTDRENYVLTTKVFWGGDSVNQKGLSRKHVIEGVKRSLKRLQTSYVDVIFAHRFDTFTPIEETCRAFDWCVRKGYALYWGTSEWPAEKIREAIDLCERFKLVKPVVEQPQYSMIYRERFEKEYASLFKEYRLGTTIWSPLAGGVLTGKYNMDIPVDSRAKVSPMAFALDRWLHPDKIENTRKIVSQVVEIAKEIGCSAAQLALAWAVKNKDVSTAIIGSTKIGQLEENVKALEFMDKITPEIEARLDSILGKPDPEQEMRTFQKLPGRREVASN